MTKVLLPKLRLGRPNVGFHFFTLALAALGCSEMTNPSSDYRARDRIVFQSDRLDIKGDIFSMALDGSDVKRLTGDSFREACPSISPDGDLIAFTRNNEDLAVMRSD